MRGAIVAVMLVGACGGGKPSSGARGDDAGRRPLPEIAEALPAGAADGAIGPPGKLTFVDAADDGSWVMVCQDQRLHVVVGDGLGLTADRALAASDRDVLVIGNALVHVDAVARTWRRLGPAGAATVDAASRRIVQAHGDALIVRDPGVPSREVAIAGPIAALWPHGKRWLEVASGEPSRALTDGECGFVGGSSYEHQSEELSTVDLDPSGVEAIDRVGPELGITAAGEVTLDGAVVVGAECVGDVIAALADPPRALVICEHGRNVVVGGGGFSKEVGGYVSPSGRGATIADHLTLGERVVCVQGACIDLVTGRDFDTNSGNDEVWHNPRSIVRKRGGGLTIDTLAEVQQREVTLPRVTQVMTIDTATGRRRAGPAPTAPAFIDGAGRFLLYGRYVIDTDAAALVGTLDTDGLAIDARGRVLVAAGDGEGPLRWRAP